MDFGIDTVYAENVVPEVMFANLLTVNIATGFACQILLTDFSWETLPDPYFARSMQ